MSDTATALIDPTTVEWTDIGVRALPEQYRGRFLDHLNGINTVGVDHCMRDGETPSWRSPDGSFPMSPGMALDAVVKEFGIPARQVSHNMAWLAHDTSGQPGYFGDYSGTYSVLGVRTKRQTLWFIDHGANIYPVLIVNDGEHARIESE
jgi:hypothetical protein